MSAALVVLLLVDAFNWSTRSEKTRKAMAIQLSVLCRHSSLHPFPSLRPAPKSNGTGETGGTSAGKKVFWVGLRGETGGTNSRGYGPPWSHRSVASLRQLSPVVPLVPPVHREVRRVDANRKTSGEVEKISQVEALPACPQYPRWLTGVRPARR
jgi:hypothetical protein